MERLNIPETLIKSLDYSDGDLMWNSNAYHTVVGKKAGTPQAKGYRLVEYRGSRYMAHRIVWTMFNGHIPDDMVIDHIDRNPLNNRIENLRSASYSLNNLNSSSVGVYKTRSGKWQSKVVVNYKPIHLGNYKCFGEAVNRTKKFKEGILNVG